MKKFFKVVAKCGHVGRGRYYEGVFFETAESKAQAAKIVRGRGRVKHDHKDAILSVEEISEEEYIVGCKEKLDNPYFSCKNKQEQNLVMDQLLSRIKEEEKDDFDEDYREKRKSRVQYKSKKYRQQVQNCKIHLDINAI